VAGKAGEGAAKMSTDHLSGRFRIVNDHWVRKKAGNNSDPRNVFYKAMLSSQTYGEYLRRVGAITVQPETTAYVVTGEMEIRYCRNRRGWIADA
jgi:hypothetical protein